MATGRGPYIVYIWSNLLKSRRVCAIQPLQAALKSATAVGFQLRRGLLGISARSGPSMSHLLSVCDVPEEVIELEAGRAYPRVWSKARRIRLDDVPLLKNEIKVWYKNTQSQQWSQQRKHASQGETAFATESATCAM